MTSGIVAIQFKTDASDDEIMMCVHKIYSENMAYIDGMQYREFEDNEPVVDMSKWTQVDKTELFFENMEQTLLGEAYSYSGPCN